MRALQISFFVDPERRAPERLLETWHSLVDVANAVTRAGVSVTVVQASHVEGVIERDGVRFHFIAPSAEGQALARSERFVRLLGSVAPNVLHVHGLGFARDVLALRELAPDIPLLLQDHADRQPRFWRRASWRRGVAAADAVAFCARSQALPFVQQGHIGASMPIMEIPESTSRFTPGDAVAARAASNVDGGPAVLWVGHLDANKDPLTVLDAVALCLPKMPGLRLHMCYGTAPLLEAVRARLARDPALARAVNLIGRVPHAEVETLMRAADLFVLASHREGSSFALIEALATGLTPAVTDIPSLRALTGGGRVGALWKCGDAQGLADALWELAGRRDASQRARVRAHFDAELSFDAVGRKLERAYGSLALRPAAVGS